MNRLTLGALAAATALLGGAAAAQQAPPPAPAAPNFAATEITATDLGHRTWMLQGQGGNITVIAGDDGVIMVDTEFAPLHDKIKAAVGKLSDKPIRYVVDTHLHGDHTGGNQAFSLDGATLIGHANLRRSMAEGTTNALTGVKTPPAPNGALPSRTYADRMTLSVHGRRAELVHMPNAHTQGDTAVWVPDADVLATGDIVSVGARYPNIDVGDRGDIDGIVAAVDAFLKRSDAKTKIVPGHGPLMSRDDLAKYRTLVADARDAVAKLKASGMTEDQVVAAKPLAASVQSRADATDQQSVSFVRLIYRSVGG
ncbi:MBL fold metallo-hydrolase [Phenylobacterium sp.]|uniref:MBL fold metallo-hydrolase n=1 Tax=Phenylobacterium sp. TaxID=1871053 RepID=UPI0035681F9C